jgi:hypothetical protein
MVFSFIVVLLIKEKTIDLSQVTNNSIVTVKCRTIIKEKTVDLSQVTNNSIVTVRCRTIIKEKTIDLSQVTNNSIVTVKCTMELLVTWDRSMVFSFYCCSTFYSHNGVVSYSGQVDGFLFLLLFYILQSQWSC